MKTVHFICEDRVTQDMGTYVEVCWIYNISFIAPNKAIYLPCFAFQRDGHRLQVWVHGGVGSEPSEMFVRLYAKRSDHPLILKFMNGALNE